jgi:hypothetical protein
MIPERYKKLGFTKVGQKKKSTRDGKKWMVLAEKGGKYKVVHGGAEGMSDYTKHKDSERRDRFWKRHNAGSPGKSKDPFSPLYWHKKFGTWALGGDTNEEGDVWDIEDPKYKNGKWSLGDFIGPPTEEEYEASKPSFMISGVEGPSESRYSEWEKTGNVDFNPAFKAFNALAQLITGTSTAFNDAKNRKEEERRHLESLIKKPRQNYNEDGLNNIPMYLTGGESPSLSELEQGEVFKDFDNNIIKVPDNLPTHEDGGVIVNNAHKILEDTSDKRNDIISKNLKMSVDDIFNLTGVKVKRPMTHSKAFEKASEHYDSKFNKMEKNIEKNLEHAKKSDSTFSKNSLDFNMAELESIPNKEDLFEALFSHQEAVKRDMLLNNTEIFQNEDIKKYPQGGSTKQNPPKVYTDKNKQLPEVIIQGTKNGKVYTDKKQFEQAQRLYNDSLNLFNLSTKHTQLYNNIAKTSKTDKEYTERIGFNPRGHFGNLPDTEFNRLETKLNKEMLKHPSWQPITKGKLPISHYADGIRREHATTWEYKKPISPPIYKGPTHPIQKMSRLKSVPYPMDNTDVSLQAQGVQVPMPSIPQQQGNPIYGPGNTIIGYSNNMHFTPALQYTGAPNNASNLQDKYLLENPEALRQYVSKLDNYRFQNEDIKKYPQGGSTKQNPPKVYTDPILYNKAAKMYNDSLALYNMSKLQYDMLNKKGLVGKKQLPVSANNSIDIINNDDMDMTDKDIYNKLKTLKTNNIKLSKTNSPDFSHPYIKPTTMYGEETKSRNKDRFGLIQSVLNTDSSPTFNYFYDTFPKQPVVYKPQPSQQKSKITNNKELLNVKLPSGDVPRYANGQPVYIKQQPVVYKPSHPTQKMNKLPMFPYLTEDPNITMNSGQFKVPAPVVQQPKGRPVYGPGNTIIGYNNNMHFTPALQYTGAPNNASNLQDKYLLENPDALRQYVSKLDNYRFQNGGKKKSPYKELPEGYGDENRKVDYIKAYNDYHGTNFTTISEVQNHRVSVHPELVLDYYRNQGTPPTNKHTKVFGENEIDFTSADDEKILEGDVDNLWGNRQLLPQKKEFKSVDDWTTYVNNRNVVKSKDGTEYVYEGNNLYTTPVINEATNPDDGTPVQIKELDYTTTSDKKKDKFKQDLQWYDVAGALENLIDSDRIPVRYDAPDITFSGAKYINPNPQLQSATASYNTMLQRLPSTGVGFANMANIFSSKYNIDNQVLGQTENANNQIYNNQNRYEDQMRNAQSLSDYQSRQLFEKKYLMSLENQRRQRALSKGDLYDTLAKNKRLNNEGDILMQMFDYFNQYGEYNNNPYQFVQRSSADNTVMTDDSGRKYYVDPTTKKITKLTK